MHHILAERVVARLNALDAASLRAHERALLLGLAALAPADGLLVKDVALARLLGMSPDSVRRNIEELVDKGVLRIDASERADDRTITYQLTLID